MDFKELIILGVTIIVGLILLPIILRKFFSPPGAHKKDQEQDSNLKSVSSLGKGIWSFVAMKYYAMVLNRTYRVYITDKDLCGVRVGNTISTPPYPDQLTPEEWEKWQESDFYTDKNLEKKYDESDFHSGNFLAKDKANFLVHRDDIERIDYHPKKWGMGRVPYSGRLVFITKKGNIELILLGKQDATEIRQRLQK